MAIRTGDTPQEDRRRFLKHPPDILITTPESLFLLLTSQARDALRGVETVIVDEVHAVAGTKRGAHLALSPRARSTSCCGRPAQRIGLSATVRPHEEVARFLGGGRAGDDRGAASDKTFDLSVVVPVEDMAEPGDGAPARPCVSRTRRPADGGALQHLAARRRARWSSWSASHRSTIVFANSRRLAERLCARLNELAGEEIARAHHGSVSREQRLLIEEDLKAGRLPAVVATSSLELGIDMGAVDLVDPGRVAGLGGAAACSGSAGPATRWVRSAAGVVFPKFRGDLVECAVVVERMRDGAIEALRYPRNPLDVLAQHVVSMVAMDDWTVDDLERGGAPGGAVRRAPAQRPGGVARHAVRPLPVRRVRRAPSPHQLGPGRGTA